MAISYCSLASGSSGNCLWVAGGGVQVLVDCGLSARETGRRLSEVGLELGEVGSAFCGHGHSDHIKGAAVLARRAGLEIHGTIPTLAKIKGDVSPASLRTIGRGAVLELGGLTMTTLATSHDAPGSVAFVIDDGDTRLGVVTDLGSFDEKMEMALEGLDGLVLEANHDERMLLDGPYPWFLKRRIAGRGGHLSNSQASALLRRVAHDGLQHLTLAHLSEENNSPELALRTASEALDELGFSTSVSVAGQRAPSAPVKLKPRERAPAVGAASGQQLRLGRW